MVTGQPSSLRSAPSTPSCQAARLTASRGSPVRGSSTPGVPITNARSDSGEIPAEAQAVTIVPRTSSTGFCAPLGFTDTSATTLLW